MPLYARATAVSVERSRAEIEETVRRYGASKFNTGWDEDRNEATILFHIRGLYIRFTIPMPLRQDRSITHTVRRGQTVKRTERQQCDEYEQQVRQRWRALLLAIKGKLEAVECKISTLEAEFLAHVVLPNDTLLGDWLLEEVLPQIKANQMPQLGFRQVETPVDAEFETKEATCPPKSS